MNKEQAIEILNKRGTNVKNLKHIDYEVYDEGFNAFMTEEEMINYAKDQALEVEE